MELARIVRELSTHRRWLAAGVLVALAAAILSVYHVQSIVPPQLVKRQLQYSTASIQAYVDTPRSFVGDTTVDIGSGVSRATVFANLMASPGGVDRIGRLAGIPGDQIWAAGPVDPTQERVVVEPTETKRGYQIVGESDPYRVELLANNDLPVISIYTQAPTTDEAIRLATSTVTALNGYIHGQQSAERIPAAAKVTVRTIGPANGGVVNGGVDKKLAGLTFVAAFVAWCVLMLVASRMRAAWRRSAPPGLPAVNGAGPRGPSRNGHGVGRNRYGAGPNGHGAGPNGHEAGLTATRDPR